MVIKPEVDSSDKELHLRNDMAYASKNLKRFIDSNSNVNFAQNVFRPSKLGEMTRDNVGTVMDVHKKAKKPNFNKKADGD